MDQANSPSPRMKRIPGPLLVTLAGALGGAINAFLCYLDWPVPAATLPMGGNVHFPFAIIPGGAVHGGALALTAFGTYALLTRASLWIRLAAAIPVGWVAGYLAWTAVSVAINDFPISNPHEVFFWPFGSHPVEFAEPFQNFGLVALIYYLFLVLYLHEGRSLRASVLCAIVAGSLGSLWFWSTENWYFAIIHGPIWGALVGTAAWKTAPETRVPEAAKSTA